MKCGASLKTTTAFELHLKHHHPICNFEGGVRVKCPDCGETFISDKKSVGLECGRHVRKYHRDAIQFLTYILCKELFFQSNVLSTCS